MVVEEEDDEDEGARCWVALLPVFVLAIVAVETAVWDCVPTVAMVIELLEVDTEVNGVLILLLVTLVADESDDSGEDSEDGEEDESELVVPLDADVPLLDTFGESELVSGPLLTAAIEPLPDSLLALPEGW